MEETGRFGRYVLLGEVARGGMGVVYRARDTAVGRMVALKMMLGVDPEDVERFRREVRSAAQISHSGVVQIHDVGVEEGRHYYTMDFVEGPSLARVLREMGKLPPRAAARVARDVARALSAAHAKGIIHRDLKPGNILLSPESSSAEERPMHDTSLHLGGGFTDSYRVLLADFGLAKEIDTTRQLTLSGMVVGTPAYMSPEQAAGDRAGLRSDVYGVGAVLYECLAGRPPFQADQLHGLLLKVIHEDPPPIAEGISPDLRTIVAKAMAKEPGRRYASASDLADDLDRYLRGDAVAARPAGWWYRIRRKAARHKAWTAALLSISLASLAALGYFLGPSWIEVRGRREMVWPAGRSWRTVAVEGFDPYRGEVTTSPWRVTRWDPPLVPDHGFILVRTEPPGADLEFRVGGKTVANGRANGSPVRVPKGAVDVSIRLQDYEAYETAVSVGAGEQRTLDRALVHETGELHAECHPEGITMKVFRDAREITAVTLPARVTLPTGPYRLRFELQNHFSAERDVDIVRGAPRRIHASVPPRTLWSVDTGLKTPHMIGSGDLDGDGVKDVVIGSKEGRVRALSGRDGSLVWERRVTPDLLRRRGVLRDLDRDGTPDVILPSGPAALSGRDGRILWTLTPHGWKLSLCFLGEHLASINDQGHLESISLPDGGEIWSRKIPAYDRLAETSEDFDGDGAPDLVLLGNGGLSLFSPAKMKLLWIRNTEGRTWASIGRDVNGDGTPDIAWSTLTGHAGIACGRTGTRIWEVTFTNQGGDDPPTWSVEHLWVLNQTGVVAYSIPDGKELWRSAAPLSSQGRVLVLDPDTILAAGFNGSVSALSREDGRVLWEFQTEDILPSEPLLADLDEDGSPEGLILTYEGKLVAFRTTRTPEVWSAKLEGSGVLSMAVDSAVRRVVVHTGSRRILAYDAADGSKVWETEAVYPDGMFFVPDRNGDGAEDLYAVGGKRLAVYCGRTGTVLWKEESTAIGLRASEPGDLDGDGSWDVVVRDMKELWALSLKDGARLWTGSAEWKSARTFVIGSGTCFLGTTDGRVLSVDPRNGTQRWKRRIGSSYTIVYALGSDCVARTEDGEIARLDGSTGAPRWERTVDVYTTVHVGQLAPDPGPELLLVSMTSVRVLSSDTGETRWSLPNASTSAMLGDVDGDGWQEVVVLGDALRVLSGRDGAILARLGAYHEVTGSGATLFASRGGNTLRRIEPRLRRASPEAHASQESWIALASLEFESEAGRLHRRGLARLRLGRFRDALADFSKAADLGLASPELAADTIEARVGAGEGLSGLEIRADAAILLLAPGRLGAASRESIARQLSGEEPHVLLLRGRPAEALEKLPRGESWDVSALLLRSIARRALGDEAGAEGDLDVAERLDPFDRRARLLRSR